ncbi:hypothetical protein HMN09_00579200 [Mycena chlorophos]|uniref:XPG-I domain-containing protein n=1 Tax=Mycena chlorophos TaxID=658473 RepID=A0A8H6T4S2_MYCCL|nr:hypothetical protein HMN09_00579200 [Mycena chlorophos]
MRLEELWKFLLPAGKIHSFTSLALENWDGTSERVLRIGINANVWLNHTQVEASKKGTASEARLFLFRGARMQRFPVKVVFVFDGTDSEVPFWLKDRVNRALVEKFGSAVKDVIEGMGFEWKEAPGSADAELVYMNRQGELDAVLTDNFQAFLFGALTVMNNWSNNLPINKDHRIVNSQNKDDKNHVRVLRSEDLDFSRNDLTLMALFSQEAGMSSRCTLTTRLPAGLGDQLCEAAKGGSKEAVRKFLRTSHWTRDLIRELRKDPQHESLANIVQNTSSFPNIDFLLSCVNPITSDTCKRPLVQSPPGTKLDFGNLAAVCERHFEWAYRDRLLKRFRSVFFPGFILQILLRAVYDDKKIDEHDPASLITEVFSSLAQSPVGDEYEFISKITLLRTHAYTDSTPQYRVIVHPQVLAEFTASGLLGTRHPRPPLSRDDNGDPATAGAVDEDDGMDDEFDAEEQEAEKGAGEGPEAEKKELRVWIPEVVASRAIPRLVQQFADAREEKAQKEVEKVERREAREAKKAAAAAAAGAAGNEPPKTPKKTKPASKTQASSSAKKGKGKATPAKPVPSAEEFFTPRSKKAGNAASPPQSLDATLVASSGSASASTPEEEQEEPPPEKVRSRGLSRPPISLPGPAPTLASTSRTAVSASASASRSSPTPKKRGRKRGRSPTSIPKLAFVVPPRKAARTSEKQRTPRAAESSSKSADAEVIEIMSD